MKIIVQVGAFCLVLVLMCNAYGQEYKQGESLYNSKCSVCHGINGDGKGSAAVAFNPAPTAFVQPEFWKKDTRGLITDSILHGRGKMPAVNLSPQEIKAIIDYMTRAYKK
jgi:mono/diheme cytochrome c family protein